MSAPTVVRAMGPDAERIADEVISRSLEFGSVRDMLIAAAGAAVPVPASTLPVATNGRDCSCVAGDDGVVFGHQDCPRHGHAGRLDALLHELAQAQVTLGRTLDDPGVMSDGSSRSVAAVESRDGVLTAIAVHLLRQNLGVSPDVPVSDVRERLVRPCLDADRWQAPSRAYRAAITVVLRALGVPSELLTEES